MKRNSNCFFDKVFAIVYNRLITIYAFRRFIEIVRISTSCELKPTHLTLYLPLVKWSPSPHTISTSCEVKPISSHYIYLLWSEAHTPHIISTSCEVKPISSMVVGPSTTKRCVLVLLLFPGVKPGVRGPRLSPALLLSLAGFVTVRF